MKMSLNQYLRTFISNHALIYENMQLREVNTYLRVHGYILYFVYVTINFNLCLELCSNNTI